MNGWRYTVCVQAIRMFLILTTHLAVDFFNHLNMLYGTITEFCTAQEVCPLITNRELLVDYSIW